MSGTQYAVKAFVCEEVDDGDTTLVFKPTENEDQIFNAPSTSLFFADKEEMTDDEIVLMFQTRYPTRLLGMCRVDANFTGGYVNNEKTKRNEYKHRVDKVTVVPERKAVFNGTEHEAAKLAAEHGPIRLPDRWQWRRDLDETELGNLGCYTRHSKTRNQDEIVYDPKVVERRRKKSKDPVNTRTCKYLTVCEVTPVAAAAKNRLDKEIDLDGWYYSHWTRNVVISNFIRWVTLFNIVFGRGAHRQLEEFQKLMTLWRDDGIRTSTMSAWANSWSRMEMRCVWSFLDLEKQFKKPRKRELKVKGDFWFTPAAPVPCPGFEAKHLEALQQCHIGERMAIWLDSSSKPVRGNLKEVKAQGLVIGEKGIHCDWEEIYEIRIYGDHIDQFFKRETDE